MEYNEILAQLEALANRENVAGMARFGIRPQTKVYGISVVNVRKIGRQIGKNHALAQQLWTSGIHEARILATVIADYKQVTPESMEVWVKDFDSWDICDQCCGNLFSKTPFAIQKALEWSARSEEFVKRAGFVLMADLAHKSKKTSDEQLAAFLPIIQREAGDERNFVKKAINWALRDIGKRNLNLNQQAIDTAKVIQQSNSKAARWVANDALRELSSEKVQERLKKRSSGSKI